MTELCRESLSLNVDCVEFRRSDCVLACGLYQLVDDVRKGGISLFRYDSKETCNQLIPLTNLETSGVFDLKWLNDRPILLAAHADGRLTLHQTDDEGKNLHFSSTLTLTENMLLQTDVTENDKFVVSDNEGNLHRGKLDNDGLRVTDTWRAHFDDSSRYSNEVWCCSYARADPRRLYSGGEDCRWKMWDTRDTTNTPSVVCNYHTAGVVSVVAHPTNEYQLFTGSYDDSICVWDVRRVKTPEFQTNLGGGVWKIKFCPSDSSKILCALMYNGWSVLNYDVVERRLNVDHVGRLNDKLLYGVDWCPNSIDCFVCCTFYDSTLRLFKL